MVSTAAALVLGTSGGCDKCEQAHRDAAAAWNDVANYARDVSAWWGQMEVEEGAKGHYGVPELATEERERWRKAYRKALDTHAAVRTSGGRSRPPEVDKAVDELSGLKAPREYEEWADKLAGAKRAVDHMVYVCPASR